MMRALPLFLAVTAATTLPAVAWPQTGVTDPLTLKICSEVRDTPLPAADRPAPADASALADCKSEDLYFGFSGQPDFENARKCAFLEVDRPTTARGAFAGKTILMMIYANARGVSRNYDLALKLACEVPGSPGDVAGRVRQLERFRQSGANAESFSVCDHSADKYMYEQCAQLDFRFDHAEREKTLDAMAATMTAAQKSAFETLRRTAAAFFEVQAKRGRDLTGTFEVQEVGFLERTFVESLQQLQQGDLPRFSAVEAQKADAEMSAAFDKAIAQKFSAPSTLTAGGLKAAQQAWAPYRDAWVAFGTRRYPAVTAASWRAWITQQRTGALLNAAS